MACRGLVMPGATSWLYTPYQILVLTSGVWWPLLWIYAVCDVAIRCHINACKPTFWRSLLTQHAYCSTYTLLTCCCTICHCNEHKFTAIEFMRPEQNTALKAKTEQFITAKISGNALKQESRTHSVLRQRSSQQQKCSIRLRVKAV